MDAVHTDLIKAFNFISHGKLLIKLYAYYIVCAWICYFLTNRRQHVLIKNCLSQWLPCNCGIPQGGVLGAILFLIFNNDLPDCIQYSGILLHADDAKIFKRINCMLDCILFSEI